MPKILKKLNIIFRCIPTHYAIVLDKKATVTFNRSHCFWQFSNKKIALAMFSSHTYIVFYVNGFVISKE